MISLLLVYYEESRFLEKVLNDLKSKTHELVVILGHTPSPKEWELLEKFPCQLIDGSKEDRTRYKIGIDNLINQGIDLCHGDWILMLRENEFLDDTALSFLKEEYFKDPAYAIRRKTFLRGYDESIHFFFNFPDPQIRLFQKKCSWAEGLNAPLEGYNSIRYFPGHIILDALKTKTKSFLKVDSSIAGKINFMEMRLDG